MFKFLGFLMLLAAFSGACGSKTAAPVGQTNNSGNSGEGNSVADKSTAAFGEKTKFSKGRPVKFAGFTLTYMGERTVGIEKPQRQFTYQDFKIKTETEEKTVSWSSGLGEIAPTPFEIGGVNYALELRASDKLGNLDTDELVIWKK
jgi:hypothetical protein